MNCLFIVNSILSPKTARFWKKNQNIILGQLPNSEAFYPESYTLSPAIDIKGFEIIVFIGNDGFFSRMVNNFYPLITDNLGRNTLGFISDSKSSALTDGLGITPHLESLLQLIKKNRSITMDLLRCNYIDIHGFPASSLVLNDVLIGIPFMKYPIILRNVMQMIKLFSPILLKKKKISLINEKRVIYDGNYVFSFLLMGRKITKGPRIRSQLRMNLNSFGYYQLNYQTLINKNWSLSNLFSRKSLSRHKYLFHRKFSELEIKGIGQDNRIIGDGLHLGRLPATFTLLPKAVRVISPLLPIISKEPWKNRIVNLEIAKPVGNSRASNKENM